MTIAALGGEIQVATLKGSVRYNVPQGTQPGTTFRLKEQGVPRLNSSGRGDLLVRVNVQIPKRLNDEQRELVEKLAESLGDKDSDAPKPMKRTIIDRMKDKLNEGGIDSIKAELISRLFVLVDKDKLSRRPLKLAPAKKVNMQVVYALPAVLTGVYNKAKAMLNAELFGYC